MSKRAGTLVVLILTLAGVLVAQSPDPYGKYDKPVTINIGMSLEATGKFPDGDGPENSIYTRYLKESYNIVVKNMWQASEADYPRKVNLSIAANDLPDAMVVNDAQLRQMLKAGQIQDLTAAWNQYASPVLKTAWEKTKGTAAAAVTFGGKIMAIPQIAVPDDGYSVAWIRKDWLDKLGLKPPKTMADLEAVARAFVEKDPGDLGKGKTIGIGGPASGAALTGNFLLASTNNAFQFDPIFAAHGAYPGFWIKGKDGKAAYGSVQPEAKTALAKLADLYKKGLIDPQMGIRKDATEAIVAGQVGIFFGPWWHGYWPFPDAVKLNPNANWQAYAVPLNGSGKWAPHTGSSHGRFAVVRKGYDHPEALIKVLNGLARDESIFDTKSTRIENFPLRVVITMPDELITARAAMLDVVVGKKPIQEYQSEKYKPYSKLLDDIKAFQSVKKVPLDKMDIQYWDTSSPDWPRTYSIIVGTQPFAEAPPVGAQLPFYSSTRTIEAKWSALKKLEDETFLRIVLGGVPLSAFDEFVTKWKAQGGDTIATEVQAERN